MEQHFNSGEDYANALIKDMVRLERDRMFGPPMEERLMELWIENIKKFANQTYQEYITGKRETYVFNDTEFQELFNEASLQYTSEIVGDLVAKGALQMSIGDDGEILYSVTEEGKKLYNDAIRKSK